MDGLRTLVIVAFQVCAASSALGWANNYRIEVLFTKFDSGGIIHNGKRCDVFTVCDPVLYSYVDIDLPLATYPGAARSLSEFQKFVDERSKNSFPLSSRISKNLCRRGRLPQNVNVRVEAYDYDYFTKLDLIDKFECVLPFAPTTRDEMKWSTSSSCRPLYQPVKHKLNYRWRVVPILPHECDSSDPLLPIPTTRAPPTALTRYPTMPYTTRLRTTISTTTPTTPRPSPTTQPTKMSTTRTTTTTTPTTSTTTVTSSTPETAVSSTVTTSTTNIIETTTLTKQTTAASEEPIHIPNNEIENLYVDPDYPDAYEVFNRNENLHIDVN